MTRLCASCVDPRCARAGFAVTQITDQLACEVDEHTSDESIAGADGYETADPKLATASASDS